MSELCKIHAYMRCALIRISRIHCEASGIRRNRENKRRVGLRHRRPLLLVCSATPAKIDEKSARGARLARLASSRLLALRWREARARGG